MDIEYPRSFSVDIPESDKSMPRHITDLKYRAEQLNRQISAILSELRTITLEIDAYEEVLNLQDK